MKKKISLKKLDLNKSTVSDLSGNDMKQQKGGYTPSCITWSQLHPVCQSIIEHKCQTGGTVSYIVTDCCNSDIVMDTVCNG